MKAFIHNDELYIKVIPTKALFRSSMIHQVVNRGDIFAVRLSDQALTILPGTIQVTFIDYEFTPRKTPKAAGSNKSDKSAGYDTYQANLDFNERE